MLSHDGVKIEIVPLNKDHEVDNPECVKFIEQFVKDVRDFSSQYGSNTSISYTAYNITGNPSKFPDYGDFPQAFVMRTYGRWWDKAPSKLFDYMPQNNGGIVSQDYIDVEYSYEVYPIRVSIYEIYNPGSVIGIWAQDSNRLWFKLWTGPCQTVAQKSRIFSPPLKTCKFKTKVLRLEFNHALLDYYTELDAILLIGTSEFIIPRDSLYNQSMSNLLQRLNCIRDNIDDVHNLTPDYTKATQDITILKNSIHQHCYLYKRIINDPSNSKLMNALSSHCQYIPPIEEAFNGLQEFLHEEFPKLIKEIQFHTQSTLQKSVSTKEKNVPINSHGHSLEESQGLFAVLPDETVLKILKNLDLKSLCRLCRVNKYFNNIARDALLYTSLNLKPYWYCIDVNALNILIPRSKYLQRLDLSWCGNYKRLDYQDIITFLRSCGSLLTYLRLNCCQFVNDAVVSEISQVCKNLKELCLRNCLGITNDGFSKLENLRYLERLDLYRAAIDTSTMCSIIRKNNRMKHLNLASMQDGLNMDEVAKELGNSCPYLETVDFWKALTLTPYGVRALVRCSNLREIDFGWCGGMGAPGDSLRTLLSACQSMEKVFLAALRGLTDRDLEPLLSCPNLRQLDLMGARSLTPDICYGFLLFCPKLEMIDLSFCEGISDVKIREWRQQYPRVSIKRSFQATSLELT